ncbi:DUF2851 family protein [Mesoflavibacter zeaxanthinifaciens]|uniref:DUF2851 family protein n=1 Tax=Mesoflavibacter zeaxanthinifaciens TaxID=393060 RepID=UPI0026F21EA5|nr:DUF2851 family protein [Mesoflavibacter zeaxanthinifaciens]
MQEDFLHYLWKYKKFETTNLLTTNGEVVSVKNFGSHNLNTGPDFFNAQIIIGDQLWAGNVEIHIKSSDWFVHNHEVDTNYDNVILHVVWQHDTDVFRKDNSAIPTLVLKDYVHLSALNNYQKLFSSNTTWINCENDINQIPDFVINNWLERLFFERLEQKAEVINTVLEQSKNNWEAVLFKLLAKNFGLKVNGDAFLSVANSFDFSVVMKQQNSLQNLEALFLGQAGLLENDIQDAYFLQLHKDYQFLAQKFGLKNSNVLPMQFFRLRPPNFPTIRWSQLANLYVEHKNLFSKIIDCKTKEDIYDVFKVSTSEYWNTHYTFGKASKKVSKKISTSFIDLLIINTIVPLKFCYAKQQGKDIDEELIQLLSQVSAEKNSIIDKFDSLHVKATSALQSQALLQLKNEYCSKNKCLQCAVGNTVLTN